MAPIDLRPALYSQCPPVETSRGPARKVYFPLISTKGIEMSSDGIEGMERATGRGRARKVILCATGAYIVYSLPRIILHLLRHVADDAQVVLSREAARMVSRESVEATSRNHVFIEMGETAGGVYVPRIE